MRVLVAGASGLIGREAVQQLKARGHHVRTLSRDPGRARALAGVADEVRVADATVPGALAGICEGVEVVVSALGAPVSPSAAGRQDFAEVDERANLALLAEAVRARVSRFVYVGVFTAPAYAHTPYVAAHTRVEAAVRASGLGYAFVRPTGVFGALTDFVAMARRGPLPVIAGGAATSNPVDERDVAEALVRATEASGPVEVDLGGPEVLSRRDLAALAFTALGRPPRLLPVPAWVMRAAAGAVGVFNPRLGQFLRFVVLVSTSDCVAPAVGTRRLADAFSQTAKG